MKSYQITKNLWFDTLYDVIISLLRSRHFRVHNGKEVKKEVAKCGNYY